MVLLEMDVVTSSRDSAFSSSLFYCTKSIVTLWFSHILLHSYFMFCVKPSTTKL